MINFLVLYYRSNELEGAPSFAKCANSAPSHVFYGMNGGLLRSNAKNGPLLDFSSLVADLQIGS
jgi:hypothetical protein